MSLEDDIKRVAEQERRLVFTRFDERTAWEVGEAIRSLADAASAPLVIDVRFWDRPLYYCALSGTSADNQDWARRKSNCVRRYGRSSFAMMLRHENDGRSFQPHHNVDNADIAAHGGSFPIRIKDVGVVGAISVSGVPSRHDHGFVVEGICHQLGIAHADMALPRDGFAG